MSTAQHTPGPWLIERHKTSITAIGPCEAADYAGYAWLEVSEADAHLIAAAPELLESLQAMVSNYDIERQWHSAKGGDDYLDSLTVRQARAAIAKGAGSAA